MPLWHCHNVAWNVSPVTSDDYGDDDVVAGLANYYLCNQQHKKYFVAIVANASDYKVDSLLHCLLYPAVMNGDCARLIAWLTAWSIDCRNK